MQPVWTEDDRLAALRSYRVLDTPSEPTFDDLVQLAARACQAPIALISLIDERRQWFKAEVGLGVRETPLDRSICLSAMLQPRLTIIPSLTKDPRFAHNPLVTGEPHLRFYAGAVLKTPDGVPLGALCVLDCMPRDLTEEQASTLTVLARQVMSQLELRRAIAERDERLEAGQQIEQRQTLLVRELHHRVKNTLATVQALVGATGRSSGSFREFYHSFSNRIVSLAKTHNLLTEDYWQTASLREIALTELKPFAESRQPRFMLIGPSVELSADLAVPVGMALHELTANAVRYGALSVPAGYVQIRWSVGEREGARRLHLEWREFGGPPVNTPRHRGFGSTLLQRVLPMQCQAEVEVQYDREGLQFQMNAPLVEQRLVPAY
ncbi:sensor histidine kinase [Microvirga tunisiensis]|uniref:histidine kinase n=1 Tax=Microvirga tunisiensis TaxID=2108360 RepID=A0A5N7MY21_9HYPH|nr:HWE histidine kinase domain-containing protein [Microvirga tunisiensis]MPR13537.1 GAF domain-containing protein [Microvirga tunisiensis]MPR31389.1 GAF domain-containing protein [Microvirga tunisiensis]